MLQNLLSDNETTTGDEEEGVVEESEYDDEMGKVEPSSRHEGVRRKRKVTKYVHNNL